MKSYKDILIESESVFGIPILVDSYNDWDRRTKFILNNVWDKIANYQLMKFAKDIQLELIHKDYQRQLLYLGILNMFMIQFITYPENTLLATDKNLLEVEDLLLNKNICLRIPTIEYDYFDVFLYLDSFYIESCSGTNLKIPFIVGIKYEQNMNEDSHLDLKRYGNFIIITLNKNKNGQEINTALDVIAEKLNDHYFIHNEFV